MIPSGHLVGIYRASNESTMAALVRQATAIGWSTALWALDTEAPSLSDVTVGVGPGPKFVLLNRLLQSAPCPTASSLVVTDDDVAIRSGSLPLLIARGSAFGLGLYQPAHSRHSHVSHAITRRSRWCHARRTSFVEIGPLFVVAPAWCDRVVPFPEDMGMGWGIEVLWYRLQANGLRLGIIDDVTIDHLSPPALTYDAQDDSRRMLRLVAQEGAVSLGDLQRVKQRWRRWRRWPPSHPGVGGQRGARVRDEPLAGTDDLAE